MDFIQHLPFNPVCDHPLTEYHNTFLGQIIHFCPLCQTYLRLTVTNSLKQTAKRKNSATSDATNSNYSQKSNASAIPTLSDTETTDSELVPGGGQDVMFEDKVYEFKRQLISNILAENRWNQCRAAKVLGMHRNTLSRYITILRIQFPSNIRAENAKFADAQKRAMTHRVDVCIVAPATR